MTFDPSILIEAGRFNKPHGIKGEISATVTVDADLESARCLFVEVDGLMVPFFISAIRPKTAETSLITLDGVESEQQARPFVNQPFYLLPEDVEDAGELDPDADGFYASDFIGFTVSDSALGDLGEITDVDDQTDNVLFVVRTPGGKEILIPVADEFIDSIDVADRHITITLPDGIVDLNN